MFIPYCPGTSSPQGLLDHFFCLTWWTAASEDRVHLNCWWAPSSPTSLPAQWPCLFFCDSEFAFWNLKSFQPVLSRHFPVFYHLLVPSPTTQNSPSTRGPWRLLLHCCRPELYSYLSGWSTVPFATERGLQCSCRGAMALPRFSRVSGLVLLTQMPRSLWESLLSLS